MTIILYALMTYILTAVLSLAVTGIIVVVGTKMNKKRDKDYDSTD